MKIAFMKYIKSVYSEEIIYPYYLKNTLKQQFIGLDILNYNESCGFTDIDYDYYVFDVNNSESYNIIKNIIFEKGINCNKIILVGYYVFRHYYKIIFDNLNIHYLILYNYLTPLYHLIMSLRDNLYHYPQGLIINENGTLKFPQKDATFNNECNLTDNLFAISKRSIASLQLSIGCNKKCSYCYFPEYWKNNIIYRNVDAVSEEIEELKKEYNIDRISFQDLSFDNNSVNRIIYFIDKLKNKNIDCYFKSVLQIEFINASNEKLLKKLKDSGLYSIFVSIDGANENDLKLYGKNYSCEDINNSIKLLERQAINYSIGFINFNPYTNEKKLNDNLLFLQKHMLAADFYLLSNRLRIERKSGLYTQLKKDRLLTVDDNKSDYKFYNENVKNIFFNVSEYCKLAKSHLDIINYFTIDFISSVYYLIFKYKNLSDIFNDFLFGYERTIKTINEFHCTIYSDMISNYNHQSKIDDAFYQTTIKDINNLAFKLKRRLYKNNIDIKDLVY